MEIHKPDSGTNFSDVTPMRGIVLDGGQELSVQVTVTPLPLVHQA